MPRTPPTHACKASRAFVRTTASSSPHAAIEAGRSARVFEALLDGQATRYYARNGLKARQAVRARHPMQLPSHPEPHSES